MIAYGVSLYWLINIFQSAAFVLHAIIALFVGFFCLILNSTNKRIQNTFLKVLFVAVSWTGDKTNFSAGVAISTGCGRLHGTGCIPQVIRIWSSAPVPGLQSGNQALSLI
jgi:hypothetical protein